MDNKKSRGLFLTSFLIFVIFTCIISLILNIVAIFISPKNMNIAILTSIIIFIKLIGITLIFLWKKIGVYIYVISNLLNIIINIIFRSNVLNCIMPGIMIILLIILIRKLWKLFV